MRSKNAIKNLSVFILYELLVFVLGIIFPRFVILTYGSEINGLTSTITRILSLVNLMQAGAVGAAIYQMYRPVAENDYETQSAIIYTSKRFYMRIAVASLSLTTAAGVFYGFHLKSETLSFIEIFLSFVILAINGSGMLLVNSICDIFISPHQKKYYLTISRTCEQVVRYSVLAIALVLKLPFIFIYISYLLGGTTGILLNLVFYRKLSKGKITNNPQNKNYQIPDRRYLMLSSIGSHAVSASPSVIITTVLSLVQASVFSVYSMVLTSMNTILNSIQLSVSAIFGNLVKTSDDERIFAAYNTIEFITIAVGTVLATCVGFLMMPFIQLYTAGVTDAEYMSVILIILIVADTVLIAFGCAFRYVATVYGLFKYTCNITLTCGVCGVVISVVCVSLFGMPYVMCGLIFNQFSSAIATLYILKKKIQWFKFGKLLCRTALMVVSAVIGVTACLAAPPAIESWLMWIAYGIITASCTMAVICVYCIIFDRDVAKRLLAYCKCALRR